MRRSTLIGVAPQNAGDRETRSRIALLFAFDELMALRVKWRRASEARARQLREARYDGE